MRLFLAVAVLMLAFVAYTEAQEQTFEDRFTRLREQVAEIGKTLTEKAKTTYETFKNSEFATNSKNWFQDIKDKLSGSSN